MGDLRAPAGGSGDDWAATDAGTDLLVPGGGVFQNRRLLGVTAGRLERAGLRVLTPERLPPNDRGISYGQAAIAAAVGDDSAETWAARRP